MADEGARNESRGRVMRPRLWKKTPAATYSRPEGLPSAGTGLTSVFGMGTGVAPPVKPPERSEALGSAWYSVVNDNGRRRAGDG